MISVFNLVGRSHPQWTFARSAHVRWETAPAWVCREILEQGQKSWDIGCQDGWISRLQGTFARPMNAVKNPGSNHVTVSTPKQL